MAEKRGQDLGASFVASGDLTQKQFRLLTFTNLDAYLSTTSGAVLAGVLQNKPSNRSFAALIGVGYTKLTLGGSMGAGGEFMTDNTGAAIPVGSGQFCGGYLLTSGNSGDTVDACVNIHKKGAY